MSHIAVDTETLGTRAGCAVLSIGAVTFDYVRQSLGQEFYIVINQGSCAEAGLHTDKGTLAWWGQQSAEAREVLVQSRKGGVTLTEALDQFTAYFRAQGTSNRIWSLGADFDLPILGHCYAVIGRRPPWQFVNTRCHRTLKNLLPHIEMERSGTHHNALADAKSQAMHAMRLLQAIAKAGKT